MFVSYRFDADHQRRLHQPDMPKGMIFKMSEFCTFMAARDPYYLLSPQFSIFCSESIYLRSKRKVVFVDTSTALSLLHMKFKAKDLSSLVTNADKLESTIISLDTDLRVKGVRPRSHLSVLGTFGKIIESVDELSEKITPRGVVMEPRTKPIPLQDKISLRIVTNCDDGLNNSLEVNEEQLIALMSLSLDECFDVYKIKSIIPFQNLSGSFIAGGMIQIDTEYVELVLALRMSLAFYLYNQATENKHVTRGFPLRFKDPEIKDKSKPYKMSVHKDHVYTASTGVHIRSPHFRQLINERYYQGEHENKPRGSRWTQVKGSIVNRGTAYTQECDK